MFKRNINIITTVLIGYHKTTLESSLTMEKDSTIMTLYHYISLKLDEINELYLSGGKGMDRVRIQRIHT